MTEYEAFRGPPNRGAFRPGALDLRDQGIAKFGFAIPSEEAIEVLVALSPIVELGAGLAYWASLIAAAGGRIECFEPHPGEENPYPTLKQGRAWHPTRRGSVEVLAGRPANETLLLIWPCYHKSWCEDALEQFRGSTLAYVGEGHMGCTGTDRFHELLDSQWNYDRERSVAIPTWWGIHDAFQVYHRR